MPEGYLIRRDEGDGTTARERAVGQLLRDGKNQNAIARELGISRQRVSEVRKQLEERGVDWRSWPPTKTTEERAAEAAEADRVAGIVEDPL